MPQWVTGAWTPEPCHHPGQPGRAAWLPTDPELTKIQSFLSESTETGIQPVWFLTVQRDCELKTPACAADLQDPSFYPSICSPPSLSFPSDALRQPAAAAAAASPRRALVGPSRQGNAEVFVLLSLTRFTSPHVIKVHLRGCLLGDSLPC